MRYELDEVDIDPPSRSPLLSRHRTPRALRCQIGNCPAVVLISIRIALPVQYGDWTMARSHVSPCCGVHTFVRFPIHLHMRPSAACICHASRVIRSNAAASVVRKLGRCRQPATTPFRRSVLDAVQRQGTVFSPFAALRILQSSTIHPSRFGDLSLPSFRPGIPV